MLDFTRDIQPYLVLGADGKPPVKLHHAFYQASIDHRDRLRAVFGKAYPYYLDFNRPKERDEYRLYRRHIYKNPLRSLRRRVIEVLDYIRQADDFQISFPSELSSDTPDSLETYLTGTGYSKDGNAESWFFKNVRKKYVGDPNAVLVVLPLVQPASDTVRAEPKAMLINCQGVYQHRNGEFAVLESPERSWIVGPNGREKTGKTFIFLDHDSYCIATQTARQPGDTPDKTLTTWWNITGLGEAIGENGEPGYVFKPLLHYCPAMPAKKIGKLQEDQAEQEYKSGYSSQYGQAIPVTANAPGWDGRYRAVESNDLGEEYFESILADSLPHVESAQAAQSDIEVERNFHVSSQEWRYAQKKCPDNMQAGGNCDNGRIALRDADGMLTGKTVACATCKGTGSDISGSGLGLIIVSAPTATSLSDEGRPTNLPTPPGGFIPRSIDPLREFVLEYEREKKQAYETINMQFLMETPMVQSGTAKRADREELYRTLIIEGKHLCGLLETLFEWTACQRRQETERPRVIEPTRLNIENSELTREALVEAVAKEFDSNLRKPLEKKLIGYQTGEDSVYYRRYELAERLDPYPGMKTEEKLFLMATLRVALTPGSAELQAAMDRIWLSIHFDGLVSDQLRTGDGFWKLKPDAQYIKLMEAVKNITGAFQQPMLDPTGQPIPPGGMGLLQPTVNIKNFNQVH